MIKDRARFLRTQTKGRVLKSDQISYMMQSILEMIMSLDGERNYLHTLTHDWKDEMDKKMHKITKRMETAEKDIKKHKPAAAAKVLKKAEKANEKLVKIDREVRDPMIEKAKRIEKRFPKAVKKAKKAK